MFDLDRYCKPTAAGWAFEFPNGARVSVINDPSFLFRFELLGQSDKAKEAVIEMGGKSDGLMTGLTSHEVTANLIVIGRFDG